MMYESPIKLNTIPNMEEGWTDKIAKYIAGEVDNLVLESCMKVVCDVDEAELIKALQYDRGQYEKGYADGKRYAAAAIEELQARLGEAENSVERWKDMYLTKHETKLGEWVRVDDGESYHYECSECGERPLYSRFGDIVLSGVCPMCGADMRKMEVQDG